MFVGGLKHYFEGYIVSFEKNLVADLVDMVYVVLAGSCHSGHKGLYGICWAAINLDVQVAL